MVFKFLFDPKTILGFCDSAPDLEIHCSAPKAQLGFPLPSIPSHTLQGGEALPEQLMQLQQHLDVLHALRNP